MAEEAPPYAERLGARLAPGTLLAERYCIESILGAGAFGVVWRARHVHLETECAVKLFEPQLDADPPAAGARFLQEARVMARLKCPYVAQVFDYGVHQGLPFLVLELLPGKSLASHLDARREQGGRLTPAETARVIRNVAEALHVAHGARVVHRDLKPSNIVLVPEGERYVAKVLDFGIAKWSTDAAPSMTTTRTVMGTPHYMSPEQFESARQVDHRADLWSLGVIAFECLTGQLPFPGASFIDVAFKVCKEGPLVASALGAVPAGFDAWFARATAQRREHRFASALAQAEALEQLCAAAPELAAASSATRSLSANEQHAATHTLRNARPALRRRTFWTLWLGAACLFALTAGLVLSRARSPRVAELAEKTLAVQPLSPASAPAPAAQEPSVPAAQEPSVPAAQTPSVPKPAAAAPRSASHSAARTPATPVPVPSAAQAPPPPAAADAAPAPSHEAPAEGLELVADHVPPASTSTFDRVAAKAALDEAAEKASHCRPAGDPTGEGRVQVTYEPSGRVASVSMLTSKFEDTAAGSCVLMLFRRARVPAFTGAFYIVVNKSFEIRP
jgi:serine/threonine protein kinase